MKANPRDRTRVLTEDEVVTFFTSYAAMEGGTRAMARKLNCSPSYVSDMIHERRPISQAALEVLGIKKEVTTLYVKTLMET